MANENAGDKKIDDDLIGGHHSFDAKDFFGDKKRGHRMGCTCLTLIILLVIVMVALGAGIYLAGQSNGEGVARSNTGQESDVQSSMSSQIEDSIANKNEKATIVLSEGDMVALLPTANMDVVIKPQNVFVTTKYMGFDCLMEVEPFILEGQLKFRAKSAKIGALPLPRILTGPISAGFATAAGNLTKELSMINFESVEKQEGKLVLTGKVVGR